MKSIIFLMVLLFPVILFARDSVYFDIGSLDETGKDVFLSFQFKSGEESVSSAALKKAWDDSVRIFSIDANHLVCLVKNFASDEPQNDSTNCWAEAPQEVQESKDTSESVFDQIVGDSAAFQSGKIDSFFEYWQNVGLALRNEKETARKSAPPIETDALYGATPDGIYFVAKELLKAVSAGNPRVLFSPDWKECKMVESGRYYIYRSGKRIFFPTAVFCFSIGGGRYLPHAALQGGSEILKRASQDIRENNKGGYNFVTTPVSATEIK